MAKIILDTSVLIALEDEAFDVSLAISAEDEVLVPSIVAAEFLVGVHTATTAQLKEQRKASLEQVLAMSDSLTFGTAEADAFARLKAAAILQGQKRANFDLAIAAHSLVENAILVTRDSRANFDELPGVIARVV